jgi:YVTN family beta-propeller protein
MLNRVRSSANAAPTGVLFAATAAWVWLFCAGPAAGQAKGESPRARAGQPVYKSPTCIAFSPNGRFAFVTNHTANTLAAVDTEAGKVVAEVPVGRAPTGVAVSPDGGIVFVAHTLDHSIGFVDAGKRKLVATVPCGYEPTGLAISPDGKRLYSANHISDDVSVIDVPGRKETARVPVGRAPTYLALTPDGKRLLVNNSKGRQPATDPNLTGFVSVIDTASGKVVAEKRSPGTMLLNMGIAVSGDGKYAFSVHSRPNFNITPSQLNQGWVHTNALSIFPLTDDPAGAGEVVTVLLDNVSSGVANPHGIAVSRDGRRLFVSHRGAHVVSVVDLMRLRQHLQRTKPEVLATAHVNLGFLWQQGDIVRRVPSGGRCPNGVAVSPADGSVYVANYFSDRLAVLDGTTGKLLRLIDLGGPDKMTVVRRGAMLFHDGTQCFQHWLSCTSCHPNVRSDGVNWDLLNDGQTNPKNAKSLVGSWQTPPAMAMGVRASMEVAVEKGFLFIQFVQPGDDVLEAVQAFLRSVEHIPSPFHRRPDGSLDEKARRGEKVFQKAGCRMCHPAPLYTDLRSYDVGTRTRRELARNREREFDTPSLRELYRTAPYLHDGRAATIEEVLTKHNPKDQHGRTSKLTRQELADLVAFLKSL